MKKRISIKLVGAAVLGLSMGLSPIVEAGGFKEQFIDKQDGWLDASEFLINNAFGFLPLPIIITEPAVGNGLGVAGLKLIRPKPGDPEPGPGEYRVTDMAAVAAAYTSSGSWLAGGMYFNTFRGDTRRYKATGGYADLNLDWYGGRFGILEDGIEFNVKGYMIDQEFQFRIGESAWFVGADWRYQKSNVVFKTALPITPPSLETKVSGLGVVALYERMNSRFSPTSGLSAEFSVQVNDEGIGSDFDYTEWAWKLRKYFLFADKYTLGLRFDGATTSGDVPFYMEPFVDIEGIPALRYQGPVAVTAEIRGGWDFHPRWTAMAFIGGGRTADDLSDLGSSSSHVSKGVGIRYLLAKAFGMRMGIDVAQGPEDTHVYLVAGNAWK